MKTPKDFFGKIYRWFRLLINHFLSCDGGVIDSGYRGIVEVIIVNHSKVPYQICIGQRIAQIIFHKIEKTTFQKVDALSSSERQFRGFGSTGD